MGETIINKRARLYFTHKGTEKLFEGRHPDEGVELAELVSGDTSVGHALAYCQAIEAAAGVDVPRRALSARGAAGWASSMTSRGDRHRGLCEQPLPQFALRPSQRPAGIIDSFRYT
ncbi:MAG: hypothetical protein ACRD26_25030 [Vicinamibacterales bacterium]